MYKTRLKILVLFVLFSSICNAQITELQNWLKLSPEKRPPIENLSFSNQAISQKEADTATKLLLEDKKNRLLSEYGQQWDNRLLEQGDLKMPFFYQKFGNKPEDGRSLFISLHGGGGAILIIYLKTN